MNLKEILRYFERAPLEDVCMQFLMDVTPLFCEFDLDGRGCQRVAVGLKEEVTKAWTQWECL